MDILMLIKNNNNPMRCCCCVLWAQREGWTSAGWGSELVSTKQRPSRTRRGCPGVGPAACARASRAAALRAPARPGGGPGGDWALLGGGRGWVCAPPGGPGWRFRKRGGPPGSRRVPLAPGHALSALPTTLPRSRAFRGRGPRGSGGKPRLSGKPAMLG